MKDGELTDAEKRWLAKFKSIAKHIPKGIELILTNNGYIEVFPAGAMSKHLGSGHDNFGISSNPEIGQTLITTIKCSANLIPYSEGN